MKKIIFTLLTVVAISHANGMLACMEASDVYTTEHRKPLMTSKTKIKIAVCEINTKVNLLNDSIDVLNVKLDSITVQLAEIYQKLNSLSEARKQE